MESKPKILIVDDRHENLVALRTVLKDLDIDLVEAQSGNEALKATLKNDFALALLDIQMPEMDGYELAGILREEEKTAHMPFIFISAVYTDNLNVFKGYEKGAFSFITKPFQPEILINKVKFFIEKHQQEITLHKLNIDLQQKNTELQISNKELDAFTYSVSHDLRAPLRAVNSFATLLKQEHEEKLDEDGQKLLSIIIENAMKMSGLIDSLLTLSRLGRTSISKVDIDMNQLVKQVVQELSIQQTGSKAQVKIHPLPAVSGDTTLIKQVMQNLVSNAIKYSSKTNKPKIEISASRNDDGTTYIVKDNGVGFNMRYVNKLFGVFQRLHAVDEFDGIGIGLAIVQRIVLSHGGRAWAESEEGNGATFYFRLPN